MNLVSYADLTVNGHLLVFICDYKIKVDCDFILDKFLISIMSNDMLLLKVWIKPNINSEHTVIFEQIWFFNFL